jgi:hypothetical protein
LTSAAGGLILTPMDGGRTWRMALLGALGAVALAAPMLPVLAASATAESAVAPCLAQPAGTPLGATEGALASGTLATFGTATQNQLFSAQVVLDLLKRAPSCSEVQALTLLLTKGATPAQVATAIVNATEYLNDEISSFFAALLGRPPTVTEASAFIKFMQGGATEADVQVAIINSPDYASLHPTPDALVTAIYEDLLGRLPTSIELAAGEEVLVAFDAGDVAKPIVLGSEYNDNLVPPIYESLLGRPPTTAEALFTAGELEVGASLRVVVATVAGSAEYFANQAPPTFSASIDWGDGTSGRAVLAVTADGLSVDGSHVYTEEGTFPIEVTVNASDGLTFRVGTTATVADAPLAATGLVVASTAGASALSRPLVAGVPSGSVSAALFMDADPAGMASDFTATIDWGDSTPATVGTIIANPGGGFTVVGQHTYAVRGDYRVTVTISDQGGAQATAASTAHVIGRP